MKPLVPASYAQFGVGAGGRRNNACGFRATFNGMKIPTLLLRRPAFVQIVIPSSGSSDFVRGGALTCNAVRSGLHAVNAVCRVACLAWVDRERGATHTDAWPCVSCDIPLKGCLQKRIRIGVTVVEIT